MPRRNIQPVSVAGIEFAALLNETQTYSADIPSYPVETGFSVSDNIALQPMVWAALSWASVVTWA